MTWALVVAVVWLLVAAAAALVIGRGIYMADKRSTHGAHRAPTAARGTHPARAARRMSR